MENIPANIQGYQKVTEKMAIVKPGQVWAPKSSRWMIIMIMWMLLWKQEHKNKWPEGLQALEVGTGEITLVCNAHKMKKIIVNRKYVYMRRLFRETEMASFKRLTRR